MRRSPSSSALLGLAAAFLVAFQMAAHAHSGPPFPIVSNQKAGAYDVSIWTDPDATDDRSAQGKFWVVLARADGAGDIPAGTTIHVTIQASDRKAEPRSGIAAPVEGLITRQFVALLMDHEGPFTVHVVVDGPLGHAEVDSQTDATYDVRPSAWLLPVFAFPFLAVAWLWFKVIMRRRRDALRRGEPQS
jgi:hypothetical protein